MAHDDIVEHLQEASTGIPIRRAAVAPRAEKSRIQSNCMPSTAQAAISGSFVDKARDVPRGIDLDLRGRGSMHCVKHRDVAVTMQHGNDAMSGPCPAHVDTGSSDVIARQSGVAGPSNKNRSR